MSGISVWSYTNDDLNMVANQVKEVVVAFLANEGHLSLTQEEYEEFCASYVVVLARPGIFGKLWDKFWGLDKDHYIMTVMKTPVPKQQGKAPVVQLVQNDKDKDKDKE